MEFKVNRYSCVLIALLFTVISGVNSLECYECNSAFDKHCDDIALQPPISVKSYLRNCTLPPNASPGDEPLCRRIEFTTIGQEHRIIRTCGWIKATTPCSRLDTFDLTEEVCQCFADGCNGSSFVNTNLATILFLSVAAIFRNWIKC